MEKKVREIAQILLNHPKGLKAKETANKLPNVSKKEVNKILYKNPTEFYEIDYVWYLSTKTSHSYTFENEYKNHEIELLLHIYDTPYWETKKLLDLDMLIFDRAVAHAKEIHNKGISAYSLGAMWYSLVTMSDELFHSQIEQILKQTEIDRKNRIEKIKKEQQEKKIRADEIKCICQKYGLPYSLATQLISTQISKEEIENRIIKILFYQQKYPRLNISVSNYVLSPEEDFEKFLSEKLSTPKRICNGNCSTCNRDECLNDSN